MPLKDRASPLDRDPGRAILPGMVIPAKCKLSIPASQHPTTVYSPQTPAITINKR